MIRDTTKAIGLLVGVSVAVMAGVTAQAQELKFWLRTPHPGEEAAVNQIAKEFTEANPGVTIKIESRSIDEHKSALRVAAVSSEGPDFYYNWAGLGLGGEYVKAGLSEPLERYYDQYKWRDRLLPLAVSYADLYPGVHGVPYQIRNEALFYNKSLFKKAGVEKLPTTYNELLDAAEKLKKVGVPAITFGGSVNWHVMRLMDVLLETKCGAQTHDDLKAMKLSWAETACATESFKELHKWATQYFLRPFMGYDNKQSLNHFIAGRAAMMLEGNWLGDQISHSGKDLENFGFFPFPTETGRMYGFGTLLYMSAHSKHKDLVAKFYDYFLSDAVQQEHLTAMGGVSISKNVKQKNPNSIDAKWIEILPEYKSVFVNGDQAFPLAVTTEYFRIINAVASDDLDPSKAGADMQKFIDQNG